MERRRAQPPSRLPQAPVGLGLDGGEHGGRLVDRGPEERSVIGYATFPVLLAWIDGRCQVHRSLRGPGSLAATWPQGFDAAMSRTHSTKTKGRRRKNRAVVEARPS